MRLELSIIISLFAAVIPFARDLESARADDVRVGIVQDLQGSVYLKAIGQDRWTVLRKGLNLLPGDLLKSSVRGANAAELRLIAGGSLLVGPGSLVELEGKRSVKLYRGELEIKAPQNRSLQVTGPGGFKRELEAKGRLVLRTADGKADTKTIVLAKDPRWLTGYRSSSSDEWMGSLLAKVDGRNVPLSVGYHKVNVDIRDQIVSTTVEQSFVNNTNSRLEGVFYFPLPADASISGFGMWIGDELVQADIVEKQRARAIFEEILRKRKDPGLLEWSGGNLFKARVFPIFAHSEKRIRIRYTQVLPMQGNKLVYRYALRSELLRQRPLAKLNIEVTIASSQPIEKLSSPSHELQIRQSAHSAVVYFNAESYRPERDFELHVQLQRSNAVTLVPHRRGEDGYFMLLLSPPDANRGEWQRELLPDSSGMDLVILADSSAGMDAAARKAQAEFIEAILSSLGSKDRFRLLTCDVDVHAFNSEALAATESNTKAALDFLESRLSLGWSDLDKAFEAAFAVTGKDAVLLYVGDGIGTSTDGDQVALADRLRHMGKSSGVSIHAVAPSSTYEKRVLEALASIGDGSFRTMSDVPARTAYELLSELTQPSVKNLELRFEGFDTARVYPETLPNLPAGRQQVILGRYRPDGKAKQGRVIVSGTLDGKPVKYTADVVLPAQDGGNSFLPRLWARRHLDVLLSEGRSPEVKEDIVQFSERFGIMTPYTSFLVLESDADREHYGVKRRVHMRDGEAFFAKGRNKAKFDLMRRQMKLAKSWRLRLRVRMLQEIARLGKDLMGWGVGYANSPRHGMKALHARSEVSDSREFQDDAGPVLSFKEDASAWDGKDMPLDELLAGEPALEEFEQSLKSNEAMPWPRVQAERMASAKKSIARQLAWDRDALGGYLRKGGGRGSKLRSDLKTVFKSENRRNPYYRAWRPETLRFPSLPPVSRKPAVVVKPAWPPQVLKLIADLDRRARLRDMEGGFSFTATTEYLHPLRGNVSSQVEVHSLMSSTMNFVEQHHLFGISQGTAGWFADGEYKTVLTGMRLGRKRESAPHELASIELPFPDYASLRRLRGYLAHKVSLIEREDGLLILRFDAPAPTILSFELEIDPIKKVVIGTRSFLKGKPGTYSKFSGFEEHGGVFWATSYEQFDAKQQLVQRRKLVIKALESEALFRHVFLKKTASFADVVFLGDKLPSLAVATEHRQEKKASFADLITIILDRASHQQWDKVFELWQEARIHVGRRPGAFWIESMLQTMGSRGQDFVKQARLQIQKLIKTHPRDGVFLVETLLNQLQNRLTADLRLEIEDSVRPLYADADVLWLKRRARTLLQAGKRSEATAMLRALVDERPYDLQILQAYINAAAASAEIADVLERITDFLATKELWQPYERQQLFQQIVNILWNQQRYEEAGRILEDWLTQKPKQDHPYQMLAAVKLRSGRKKEVDLWIRTIFDKALEGELDVDSMHELSAAIQWSLGRGWNHYQQHIDQKWFAPLARLAIVLLEREDRFLYLAGRIFSDYRFKQASVFVKIQKQLVEHLLSKDALAGMVQNRLSQMLYWIDWSEKHVAKELYEAVITGLMERWAKSENESERNGVGSQIVRLLDIRSQGKRAIDFLRKRLQAAKEPYKPGLARLLLNRLRGEDWSIELEREFFVLIELVVVKGSNKEQRKQELAGVIRFVADTLFSMRIANSFAQLKDTARLKEVGELPRAEQRLRRKSAVRAVRQALAKSFRKAGADAPSAERTYYWIESLCFAAQAGTKPMEIWAEAREIYQEFATKNKDGFERILRERTSLIMSYAATRRTADKKVMDSVLNFYRERERSEAEFLDWRYQIFRLLLAANDVAQLESEFLAWHAAGKLPLFWRSAYAYVLAEKGRFKKAASLFESLDSSKEIGPPEFAMLAACYLALGNEAGHRRALAKQYASMSESQLASMLNRENQRISARKKGDSVALDPKIFDVLDALMHKSPYPQNYIYQIRNLYRSLKDFRLLASLAEGVGARPSQGFYAYLQSCRQLIQMIFEEATCDQLVTRVQELANAAKSTEDKRAYHLFEAMVLRRAAQVRNEPGPHIENARRALIQAFKGGFQSGESLLLARYLSSLGVLPEGSLAEIQRKQVMTLWKKAKRGSLSRLRIAKELYVLQWSYNRQDKAIDGLSAALTEFQNANPVANQHEADQIGNTLLTWLEARRRYRRGESYLTAAMARLSDKSHVTRRSKLESRLFQLYINCLSNDGNVSLGKGSPLFRATKSRLEEAMVQQRGSELRLLLTHFVNLHKVAGKRRKFRGAGPALERFAKTKLGEILLRMPNQALSVVQNVARGIRDLSGPIPALRCLIEYMERSKPDYNAHGQNPWQRFASSLGYWRHQAKQIGSLEPRLLALVVAELERDLRTMRQHNRTMYQQYNSYFWTAKKEDFARVARYVIKDNPEAGALLLYAANYLWNGLRMQEEAVAVLADADARAVLQEQGRFQLSEYLQSLKRWSQSVAVLRDLVATKPKMAQYRTSLFKALFHADQDQEALALLAASEAALGPRKSWPIHVTATFASLCLQARFYKKTVELYSEVIARHEETAPKRGIGDGTLSSYYGDLARGLIHLGQVDEAVDAASKAVISWGKNMNNRRSALRVVTEVLGQVKDLNAFVRRRDELVAKEGLDAAILRKALGQIYTKKRQFERAIVQLEKARDLQAHDSEIHQALWQAWKALNNSEGMAKSLLTWIRSEPLKLELYRQLAQLYQRTGERAAAERAWTSLVEMKPLEAVGHQMLAQQREEQRRDTEAALQWQQVMRIRTAEPVAYFGLARCQQRLGKMADARKVLGNMIKKSWEPRFGNVRQQAQRLLSQLRAGRPGR